MEAEPSALLQGQEQDLDYCDWKVRGNDAQIRSECWKEKVVMATLFF